MKQIITVLCLLLLLSCSTINRWARESYERDLEKQKPKKTVHIEKVGLEWQIREKGGD